MYESITYEMLLERMLSQVPDSMDKREGSIIYDALAPAAVEMKKMYLELDAVLKEMFADTAGREYLIKRAAERGLSPKPATCAMWKGSFNMEIPKGSRFSSGGLNFQAGEKTDAYSYQMLCETAGTQGNEAEELLIPIEYIPGLTEAKLTELLIPGEDEEETERFRKRYFASLDASAFGGNIADYKEKVNQISGVGGVRVYPVWNGGGTVKLVIIDSRYQAPSQELVSQVQSTIDPVEYSGQGLGLAPIDHTVTVEGAKTEEIDIEAVFSYQSGWDFAASKTRIFEILDAYFEELNRGWEETDTLIVRNSQIISRLLEAEGILDVSEMKINGGEGNYEVQKDRVVKRGTVNGA